MDERRAQSQVNVQTGDAAGHTSGPSTGTTTGQSCACPRCGYDLGGQVAAWSEHCPLEGTCPECGLSFRWGAVFDEALDPPVWSFEHSDAPLIAYAKSLAPSLRPWRLWRRLTMRHELVQTRLGITLALIAAGMWALVGLVNVWLAVSYPPADLITAFIHPERPVSEAIGSLLYYRLTPTLLGLVLLPCAFSLLPATLARLRVRRLHLLRLTAYSMAPAYVAVLGMVLCRGISIAGANRLFGSTPFLNPIYGRLNHTTTYLDDRPYVWPVLLAAWMGLYWWVGAKRYLKLRRAGLTVALLLAMTALASVLVCGFWPGSPLFTEIDAFFRGWV